MFRRTILLAIPVSWAFVAGCVGDGGDIGMRNAERSFTGRRVEIQWPNTAEPSEMREIGQYAESLGTIESANVRIMRTDEGGQLIMEIWGKDLPDDRVLASELRAEFPGLTGAEIEVAKLDTSMAPEPLDQEVSNRDPEAVRRIIRERLRADGLDPDDVDITVIDEGDERRVEVRVEKTLEQ